MVMRYFADRSGLGLHIPRSLTEILGTVGLIMIVLEAGLDLEVTRAKLPLIRSSLRSATVVLAVSSLGVAAILKWWLPDASWMSCMAYSIALSVVSSAIVLPSVHHLGPEKREFLIYEASFSDVLGIMLFNFITAGQVVTGESAAWFLGSIPIALLLSIVVCFGLMWLLVKNRVNVKFFLVFAVLVVVYVGGKSLHLPSLLTVLMFGLVVNNWEWVRWKPLKSYFSEDSVNEMAAFLKSITSESAFLIRTFFFIIFGFSIDLAFLQDQQVWLLGSAIVGALLVLRFIYLRIVHKYDLFPEIFYIPRGLITVLLFYKIPDWQQIGRFNEGVLFFVILATTLIMMVGSMLYRDRPVQIDHGDAMPSGE
jgi:NhaP-type Na+/H+ or K+/H+ antiporter